MSQHYKEDDLKQTGSIDHVEQVKEYHVESGGLTADGHKDIDYGFDPAEIKATMRKVDIRLMPIMAALYTVSGTFQLTLTPGLRYGPRQSCLCPCCQRNSNG